MYRVIVVGRRPGELEEILAWTDWRDRGTPDELAFLAEATTFAKKGRARKICEGDRARFEAQEVVIYLFERETDRRLYHVPLSDLDIWD